MITSGCVYREDRWSIDIAWLVFSKGSKPVDEVILRYLRRCECREAGLIVAPRASRCRLADPAVGQQTRPGHRAGNHRPSGIRNRCWIRRETGPRDRPPRPPANVCKTGPQRSFPHRTDPNFARPLVDPNHRTLSRRRTGFNRRPLRSFGPALLICVPVGRCSDPPRKPPAVPQIPVFRQPGAVKGILPGSAPGGPF